MNWLLGLIAILHDLTQITKEATTQQLPKGTRFDWDAYNRDTANGMDCMTQLRKSRRGEYYTTKPAAPLCYDDVINREAYEKDRWIMGAEYAERARKLGLYK